MSKTTIILAIIAIILIIILACVGYYVNHRSDTTTQINSTANTSSQTGDAIKELNVDASNVELNKTLNFFSADENQETDDFDNETSDSSQIKVDSQDLLNLSQSYENSDL